MSRITISLDNKIEQKIKELQISLGQYSGKQWSTSKMINILLYAGILSEGKLHINEWSKIQNLLRGDHTSLNEVKMDEFLFHLVIPKQSFSY